MRRVTLALALALLAAARPAAAVERTLDRDDVLDRMRATRGSELRVLRSGRESELPAARVQLQAGSVLLAKPAAGAQPQILDAAAVHRLAPELRAGESFSAVRLPTRVALVDAGERTATTLRRLEVVVLVDRALRPDPASGRYEGRIRVGLIDAENPLATGRLPEPVPVTIGAELDEIVPSQIELAALNRDFVSVALATTAPPAQVRLRFLGPLAGGEALELPVLRPALSVSPREIAAFGLGSAVVTVRRDAGTADRVGLETGHGSLGETSIAFGAGGEASTTLRSGNRVGDDVVRTTAGLPRPETAEVRYVWPTAYTVATLVGATLGALAAVAIRRRQSGRGDAGTVVEGLVGGILGGLAPPLGIQLLPIPVPEGAAAAAGLFCAIVAAIVLPLSGWRRLLGGSSP